MIPPPLSETEIKKLLAEALAFAHELLEDEKKKMGGNINDN